MAKRNRVADHPFDGLTVPHGFDPLRAGRPRTSGVMPSFKAPAASLPAYISTSSVESDLGLWGEVNPDLVETARLDVSDAAGKTYGLEPLSGLELCNPIRYRFDGQTRFYLPDLAARTKTGALVIAEAGVLENKSNDETRAALDAARDYVGSDGHVYVLLKGDMNRRWRIRALSLHLWRFGSVVPDELIADIWSAWSMARTPRSLVEQFAGRASEQQLRHAVMKVAGDALAAGRLAIDLNRDDFTVDTSVRIRPVGEVHLPPAIRTHLPTDAEIAADQDADDLADLGARHIQEDLLAPADLADLRRMREIMHRIEGGTPASTFADELGCTARWVQYLYHEWVTTGRPDGVLVRDATRPDRHASTIDERLKTYIKRQVRKFPLTKASAIERDPTFRALCRRLPLPVPSARRIAHYIGLLKFEINGIGKVTTSRAQPTRAFTVGYSAVYGARPAYLVEIDEERSNLVAQLLPGHPATDRFHRLMMTCAGTKAPISIVPSMKQTDQGDIRQLALVAALPKDHLTARAGCVHPWAIEAWPMIWRFDNAWANTARMLIRALPARGVYLEYAPAYRPESKPVQEGAFGRSQRIHQNRQPNSVQGHPSLRNGAEPERYAAEHAMTPQDIEDDFIVMEVDGNLHGAAPDAAKVPWHEWQIGEENYWHRTYEGDAGELYRVLKRRIPGTRTVSASKSISYRGRDYGELWAEDRDTDPRNDLPYQTRKSGFVRHTAKIVCYIDDNDVRTMDVYDTDEEKPNFLGSLVCNLVSLRPEGGLTDEKGNRIANGPKSEFRLALDKELMAETLAAARDSRTTAQTTVDDRNLARPRKRVPRAISRVKATEQKHLRDLGMVNRARRDRAAGSAEPSARRVFTPSSKKYTAPPMHIPAPKVRPPSVPDRPSLPSRSDRS